MIDFLKRTPRTGSGLTASRHTGQPTSTGDPSSAMQAVALPLQCAPPSSRRRPSSARMTLAAILTVLASGTLSAQTIMNPPQLPQDITVFPQRDFTSISGFAANADVRVQLLRGGMVSDAVGRTDATGFFEVNHPGGVCWRRVTPDIVPADVVRVTYDDTEHNRLNVPTAAIGSGAATTTQNVTASQAFDAGNGTVVIKGKAQLTDGTPISLTQLEVRIVNPGFIGSGSRIGRRSIRADSAGGRVDGIGGTPIPGTSGTLAYDSATASTFTAVFSGLNDYERLLVVEGQTRVMGWQQTTAAGDRLGMTIYEVGELGGPGIGGCPPGPNGVVPPQNPTPPVHYNPTRLLDAADVANQGSLKDVTVFPERDFISIAGFGAGTELQVVVRRGNSSTPVIGTTRGIVGRDGLFEVNHPGGVCWTGQTPNVQPGDWIDVFKVNNLQFSEGQTQRVINAVIKKPAFINNGLVKVEGIAVNEIGSPLPLGLTEQRIVNPDFTNTRISRIGRRDIRADINGGRVGNIAGVTGTLTAKGGGGDWEAVYRGLTLDEQKLAVAGQSRAMAWHSTNGNGDRFGMTIFEFGEVGGPGISGCPATGSALIAIP